MGKKVIPTTVPGPHPITSSAVVQVRGTSGAGKTTLMRALFDQMEDTRPVMLDDRLTKVRAYRGRAFGVDVYVLGDYSPERSAGGCDTIPSVQEVTDLVERYGSRPHSLLVFEGLLLAHSWGALGEYIHPRWGERYVNAFIDTPVDLCLSRVHQRRAGKGRDTEGDRAAKIEKNIRDDYYRVELCWARVEARGGVRVMLNHRCAVDQFCTLLEQTAKEYCK